jgi:hypothetical protein
MGLPDHYDTQQGRKQLRASIVCAHEFMCDILDGRFDVGDPERTVRKLNERIFRFCTRDHDAKQLYQTTGIDPARAIVDHPQLDPSFRERRMPQMQDELAGRRRDRSVGGRQPALGLRRRPRDRGPER